MNPITMIGALATGVVLWAGIGYAGVQAYEYSQTPEGQVTVSTAADIANPIN